MKLSTKSTYGLRAMLNIALRSDDSAISIADIHKEEGISAPYLEQLLNRLMHRGLIKSVRGPRGGYILSKNVGAITVADIVEALEGDIYPVHCVAGRAYRNNFCRNNRSCVPKIVWLRLAKAISACLGSITLKDLCAEAKKIEHISK